MLLDFIFIFSSPLSLIIIWNVSQWITTINNQIYFYLQRETERMKSQRQFRVPMLSLPLLAALLLCLRVTFWMEHFGNLNRGEAATVTSQPLLTHIWDRGQGNENLTPDLFCNKFQPWLLKHACFSLVGQGLSVTQRWAKDRKNLVTSASEHPFGQDIQ